MHDGHDVPRGTFSEPPPEGGVDDAPRDRHWILSPWLTAWNGRGLLSVGHGHEREPLGHYCVAICGFLGLSTTIISHLVRGGRAPDRVPVSDTVLLGLATARLSRLITREKATRPLRAPFTEMVPADDGGALEERPRPETQALGELLTCPRCMGVWASGALTIAYACSPAATRVASTMLAASLVSDLANVAFAKVRGTSPQPAT